MKVFLQKSQLNSEVCTLEVAGSKSESNRLLILQALFPNISLKNLSDSDDTSFLEQGLRATEGIIDVHHAGTAMRFLTAYFAAKDGASVILKGSDRMHQRPIGVLVESLQSMGADITYLENVGFPPLQINGKQLTEASVEVMATVSSQYISALILIAPTLPNGLVIHLEGEPTSVPYIKMTLVLLQKLGISCSFSDNKIEIMAVEKIDRTTLIVESDWSTASYFYSLVALSETQSITLKSYYSESLQGDSTLVSIFESLGVETTFYPSEAAIILSKKKEKLPKHLKLHLSDAPDLAQTIAVTCFGLGISCELTGLQTLKIKETDRLEALKTELEKLGAVVRITSNSLELDPSEGPKERIEIETYNDHRMAMAFAPLSMLVPICINDANVVTKSCPTFWEHLQEAGITVDYQ